MNAETTDEIIELLKAIVKEKDKTIKLLKEVIKSYEKKETENVPF